MYRKTIPALACLLAAMVAPATALAHRGAVKQALTGPSATLCDVGGSGPETFGFVVLDRKGARVSAVVKLHGAPAHSKWLIDLNQTPLMGCYNEVYNRDGSAATITANAQGNATAEVSVPYVPGNTGAFVELVWSNDAAKAIRYIASPGSELS